MSQVALYVEFCPYLSALDVGPVALYVVSRQGLQHPLPPGGAGERSNLYTQYTILYALGFDIFLTLQFWSKID